MPRYSSIHYIFFARGAVHAGNFSSFRISDANSSEEQDEFQYAEISFVAEIPRRIIIADTAYMRVMDRYFIPEHHCEKMTAFLFGAIADDYDSVIDAARNVGCWRMLIDVGTTYLGRPPRKCLDFGCGTGSGLIAWEQKNLPASSQLFGTDICGKMLSKAAKRGMVTIPFSSWENCREATYDLAVACYVMHYGVSPEHMAVVSDQLMPDGLLCANFFKLSPSQIDCDFALTRFSLIEWKTHPIHGAVGLFRKMQIETA